ncbi:MAG TPA: hypothetical protein VKR58_08410, partial [Aquella sp.]|nr:hypothetical protein [Aquella sp.]
MDTAIILAFSYNKNNLDTNRQHLPGILIDIYYAYSHVRQLTDEIVVITDLIMEGDISELKNSIVNSRVSIDILNLIDRLRISNCLYEYTNKSSLISILKRLCHRKKHIFFYYTGHSLHGNILLPTMNEYICYNSDHPTDFTISFLILRDIFSLANSTAQICVVLDCCGSRGLELPFVLNGDVYTLTPRSDKFFMPQQVICFSASMSDEVSVASRGGSRFTYYFFKYLKEYRNVIKFKQFLVDVCSMGSSVTGGPGGSIGTGGSKEISQTPMVHATYPNMKLIWRWLHHNDDIEVDLN